MQVETLNRTLQKTRIGEGLCDDEINQLVKAGKMLTIKAGTVLLQEGEANDTLFVLIEGDIEVIKGKQSFHDNPHLGHHLGRVCPGEVIGELGFLLRLPPLVTFRAVTDSRVFTLKQGCFEQLKALDSRIGDKLTVQLARAFDDDLKRLICEVIDLLNDHDSLLKAIEGLRHTSSSEDLEKMRRTLIAKAEEVRDNQLRLQQRFSHLDRELDKTKTARREARMVIVFAAGALGAVLVTYILNKANILPNFSAEQQVYPATIPYLTEEECAKREGAIWREGQCIDFVHSPNF